MKQSTIVPEKDLINQILEVDLAALNSFEDKFEPVQADDYVLGVLSYNLKRLNFIRTGLRRELTPLLEKLNEIADLHEKAHEAEDHSDADCEAFLHKTEEMLKMLGDRPKRLEQLDAVFWAMIRLEFPEALKQNNLSIRHGYKVVLHKRKEGGFDLSEIIHQVLSARR